MRRRAAFVLPVVLVCGLLLASMVITFQFVSSSDYKAVARLMRDAQAEALADLASDELAATVNNIQYGSSTLPSWVQDLFRDLDGRKSANAAVIDVKKPVSYQMSQFPVTSAVAQRAKGLVELTGVSGTIGPFEVLAGGGVKELIYKEDLFNDGGKDVRAWDLRGPMNLVLEAAGRGGPFEFSQRYRRGQMLEISDTTPPAKDFTLFSYLPPPSEDYALNDLQRGGKLELSGGGAAGQPTGRVLLRGPLLYLSEEAPALPATPDKIHLGDENPEITGPPGTSPSYPDNKWLVSMATVPGPRELNHPDNPTAAVGGATLPGVDNALVGVQSKMDPRRPTYEQSDSRFKTKPLTIGLRVRTLLSSPCPEEKDVSIPLPVLDLPLGGISPAIAKDLDGSSATFETIDRDVVAYYPPLAYFHAPLPTGSEKVRLRPHMPNTTVGTYFKGISVPQSGGPALFAGAAGDEGDVVVTEPVPRASGQTDAENTGVLGLYGIATHESKTYVNLDIIEVARWLVDKGIDRMPNKDRKVLDDQPLGWLGRAACSGDPTYGDIARANRDAIVTQAMQQLGLDPALKFLIRRFAVEAKLMFPSVPTNLAAATLRDRLANHEGAVAPYGSYYHDVNFWNTRPTQEVKDAIKQGIRNAEAPATMTPAQLLDALLPQGGNPAIGTVDPSWPPNTPAPAGSKAKVVRDWLADKYAAELLRFTAARGAGDPGQALTALLAVASKPRGFSELRPAVRPRPQGAFGPHQGSAPGAPPAPSPGGAGGTTVQQMVDELRTLFPKGVFPPKARDWEEAVTRSYETIDEYIAAEATGGALPLRGVVLVRTCDTSRNITYSGRGVLIVMTSDAAAPATLGGTMAPASGDTRSRITVVHRVAPGLVASGRPPALVLGSQFTGTVYSETGVKPKSGSVRIDGTLVAGLLNKQSGADSDSIRVMHVADAASTMVDAWTLESGGEVSSVDPEP